MINDLRLEKSGYFQNVLTFDISGKILMSEWPKNITQTNPQNSLRFITGDLKKLLLVSMWLLVQLHIIFFFFLILETHWYTPPAKQSVSLLHWKYILAFYKFCSLGEKKKSIYWFHCLLAVMEKTIRKSFPLLWVKEQIGISSPDFLHSF